MIFEHRKQRCLRNETSKRNLPKRNCHLYDEPYIVDRAICVSVKDKGHASRLVVQVAKKL